MMRADEIGYAARLLKTVWELVGTGEYKLLSSEEFEQLDRAFDRIEQIQDEGLKAAVRLDFAFAYRRAAVGFLMELQRIEEEKSRTKKGGSDA